MQAEEMVMGLETECSIVAPPLILDTKDDKTESGKLYLRLMHAMVEQYMFDNEMGARIYNDQHLVEGAGPECCGPRSPFDLSLYMRAMDEELLERMQTAADSMNPPIQNCHLLKGATDWKGSRYGTHLNLRVPRIVTPERLFALLLPYLLTKVIWAGRGGVAPKLGEIFRPDVAVEFVFSPRGHMTKDLISNSNAFIATKSWDNSSEHASKSTYDLAEWARLQIMGNDSLHSDLVTTIDAGITALIIRAIALDLFPYSFPNFEEIRKDSNAKDALTEEFRVLNRDATLTRQISFPSHPKLTALEVQIKYLKILQESAELLSLTEQDLQILQWFEDILYGLSEDPRELRDTCECWLTLKRAEEILWRHASNWDSCHRTRISHKGKEKLLSQQLLMFGHYLAAVDPQWGLWPRYVADGRVKTLHPQRAVSLARENPPKSRAEFRRDAFRLARELGLGLKMESDSWSQFVITKEDKITRVKSEMRFDKDDPTDKDNESKMRDFKWLLLSKNA